ncbi:SDR family oxidoreductase [Streptomyces coeruleoprunus]
MISTDLSGQPGTAPIPHEAVAVTGATGLLGSHLLARLLRTTGTHAVALVRDDPAVATRRLHTALEATGEPLPDGWHRRVVPLRVTLHRPRLGLGDADYRALAAATTEIWHCAASVRLNAPARALEATNVDGTRAVLELAADAPRGPRVQHISTAYVAGARRHGRVAEDTLEAPDGFLTGYEETKFRAERLVRRFAEEGRGRATVFRPSVLVDHRPPAPGAPHTPATVLAAKLARLSARRDSPLARRAGFAAPGLTEVRLPGDPEAHMNVLPVQYAADAIIRIARTAGPADAPAGAPCYHIVHPRPTRVVDALEALVHHAPWLRVRLDPALTEPQGPLAELVSRVSEGVAAYVRLRRTYDRTRAAAALAGLPDPAVLDARYLRACFTPPAVPYRA